MINSWSIFLALVLFACHADAQQTFRVKRNSPQVATSILRLPQYLPTANNSDTANVLWLDSVPPIGTLLSLWNDKAIIINYSIGIGGGLYVNQSAIVGENEQKLFQQALKKKAENGPHRLAGNGGRKPWQNLLALPGKI